MEIPKHCHPSKSEMKKEKKIHQSILSFFIIKDLKDIKDIKQNKKKKEGKTTK